MVFGHNLETIILKDSFGTVLWVDIEVNLISCTKLVVVSLNDQHTTVWETFPCTIHQFYGTNSIITLEKWTPDIVHKIAKKASALSQNGLV